MKKCKHRSCENEVYGRKQYCSERCNYWENQMKKDDDFGLPPLNKRNNKFFYQYIGSSYPKGQGKRVGGMCTGSLTGIPVANFLIKEFNKDNIIQHFEKARYIDYVDLCDGSRMTKSEVEKFLNKTN